MEQHTRSWRAVYAIQRELGPLNASHARSDELFRSRFRQLANPVLCAVIYTTPGFTMRLGRKAVTLVPRLIAFHRCRVLHPATRS
jgi:hypothetical protein